MPALNASVSRLVLVLFCAGIAAPALADSFTVPPASGPQKVSGTDIGEIAAGATLDGGKKAAITWDGPATDTGVVINNSGIITSGDRAIDTASDASGFFTLNNFATVTSTDDAFRIKGDFAGGWLTLENGGTIHSEEGQALDFDKAVDPTATIFVANSGSISSSASDAIRVGGGNVLISNSGTIETFADGKRGIKMDAPENFDTLQQLTISNAAGAVISGTDDGIKISSEGGSTAAPLIDIANAGTIRSTVDGQAIDLGDIASPNASIWITNYDTGLITAANDDAIQGANGMILFNAGVISSYYAAGDADEQNNSAVKIDGEDVPGGLAATIDNEETGVISGAYHGIKASGPEDVLTVTNYGRIEGRNGSGVNSNGTGQLLNYGTITGTFDPAAAFGDGDGVDFDRPATIYNLGTIAGLGSKGVKPGETKPSTSEGIAIGGGLIVNGEPYGTQAALISGANNGILADDSNGGDAFEALTVVNFGTIRGEDGFGIRMVNGAGSFGNTIVNYGTISGTTFAAAMGGGDDLFVYEAGSRVVGAVRAEGGVDTLRLGEVEGVFNLKHLGSRATYRDFERLELAEGSFWVVGGSTDFAGTTTVADASLLLRDASLAASQVSVSGSGGNIGRLAGNGSVGGLAVGGGGLAVPGGPGLPGTLAVTGDVSFADGATYEVSAARGEVAHIDAGGAATVDGGAGVELLIAPYALQWGTRYAILTADGGVTGNFGAIDSSTDFLFLTPELSADANTIYLSLARNAVPFTAFAVTRNQFAVAAALDRTGPGGAMEQPSALYDVLVQETSAQPVRTAFTQLSGEVHATLPGVLFTENTLVNDTVLGRMRQAGYAGATGATAALGLGGPAQAYADPTPAQGPIKVKAQPAAPVLTAWAQGYGQWLTVDATANAAGADSTLGGMLAGVDAAFGNAVAGFAVGYSSSSTDAGGSNADAETVRLAGYGALAFDALKLRAGATLGWSSIDTSRYVALTGEQPKASYDGLSANLFAEAGYTLALGAAAFEPFAGIGWTHLGLDSFTETGAPVSGLVSNGSSFDTFYTTLGLRAAASFDLSAGMVLTPHASAGWRHAFGDVTPTATLAFLSTGSAFGVEGLPIAEDSLVVGAGIDLALGGGVTLGVAYDGMFGDGTTYNAGKGTLAVHF